MNHTMDKLEAWAEALDWCQANLKPGTWSFDFNAITINNDEDYTLFLLSTRL